MYLNKKTKSAGLAAYVYTTFEHQFLWLMHYVSCGGDLKSMGDNLDLRVMLCRNSNSYQANYPKVTQIKLWAKRKPH